MTTEEIEEEFYGYSNDEIVAAIHKMAEDGELPKDQISDVIDAVLRAAGRMR